MSTFTSCDPRPSCCMSFTASSTVLEMPSLTLAPAEEERPQIMRHYLAGAILARDPEGLYESRGVGEMGWVPAVCQQRP